MPTPHLFTPQAANENHDRLSELEGRIDALAADYEHEFREVQELEQDINHFLDDYLQQVGPYFNTSPPPKRPANPTASSTATPANNAPTPENTDKTDTPDAAPEQDATPSSPELKTLYRKLVKIFHPDRTTETPRSTGIMTEIQEAYAEGSLTRLQRIYYYAIMRGMQTTDRKEETLQELYNEILSSLSALQTHRATLLESPEYQLMCKFQDAEENGIDLIEQVIGARRAQTRKPDVQLEDE